MILIFEPGITYTADKTAVFFAYLAKDMPLFNNFDAGCKCAKKRRRPLVVELTQMQQCIQIHCEDRCGGTDRTEYNSFLRTQSKQDRLC